MIAIGNFTMLGLRLAVYMAVSLFIGLALREYARARVAATLGDPTPRLWGRMTLRPKAWFDPFGSGFLPALVALLWSVQAFIMPAAYAKPAPIDTSYFKRHPRDVVVASSAGPVASLVLAIAAGLLVRAGIGGEALLVLTTFAYTNASLFVFHVLPIPGLDGGRLLALLLPPHAREVFRNADRYLALIVLVVLFLFTFLLGIARLLAGAVCDALTGVDCSGLFGF
ncbi:MAG TPA: site-2 protease family protein [Actinomycetota bacterium]|nr:site-2 protease family protein [Actinomycetota bacterium]